MKILFIGDVMGEPGRRAVFELLADLRKKLEIGLCIANGENAAGGFGITPRIASQLFSYGVDVLTMGNHVWDKKEIMEVIGMERRILRPANIAPGAPGAGSVVVCDISGEKVAVLNLSGRIYMSPVDCPFRCARDILPKLKKETNIIVVDFHAEITSEKMAMGWFLDGLVSAVIGTHTHVATADERILPSGTAYITDAGMTGPADSVIGVKKELVVKKFLTGMPVKFEVANENVNMMAVLLDIDEGTGKARGIQRMKIPVPI